MGHDRFGSTPAPFEPSFQSTRPARDATRHILIGPHPCCSFNPRARGGRDATAPPRSVMHSHVSIHAPAGGATQKTISTRDENSSVSIHAPAGGATDKGQLVARHRVVSIHAPAGGATPSAGKKKPPCARFNPRARGGRDKGTVWAIKRILSFNPRARGGRDKAPSRIWTHQLLFQSTRPRGARPGDARGFAAPDAFQSTRPRGARPARLPSTTQWLRFNPRARGGRDACHTAAY